ncbi:MAG: hypothetical protein HHAS10_03940 [Candidatus Altimarinota bacterium]
MQTLLLTLLKFFSKLIIERHRPYIIGVTGTVGKTTQTTYITRFLREVYGEKNVGASRYHYNGEYGLPLTIIGSKTGGKNPIKWLGVFFQAILKLFRPYPRYLVLEYGIDHPGEMQYLLSIAKPHIAILTPVAPNHLEQFGSLEKYRDAKLLLPKHAKEISIIHDSQAEFIEGEKVFYYGKKIGSAWHVHATKQALDALHIDVMIEGSKISLSLPVFGDYQAENILPLFAIGSHLHIDTSLIKEKSALFSPEPGRSSILRGQFNSTIIDGSYNGGFESIVKGLESLTPFTESHRIICFLGDMRELGAHTERMHTELAKIIESIFPKNKDIEFFVVGKEMNEFVIPILKNEFPIFGFLSSRKAGKKIAAILKKKEKPTLIYVKGSQNTIFLEEGVKEFLQDREDEKNLCRQSREWMEKKERFYSQF